MPGLRHDETLVIKNETKNEVREFSSFEEAKHYIKSIGFNDQEINDISKKVSGDAKRSIKTKISINIDQQKTPTSSERICPQCHKPLPHLGEKCSYCGNKKSIPFWKRFFGLDYI